ncbi:hypothetical protein LGN24_26530 [Burkholderia seminalis]|uniref:hypothetical protein n=1 Tax=Burkholderia seminalis TaxID=488731 RepID=UPI001CF27316|nr:hypothetical protein [Burkholderia seminalis]MCA8305046.1 hypothetical protein [Burkholderia seminalis]
MPYFRIPLFSRIVAVSAAAALGAALTLPAARAAGPAPLPTPTGDMSLSPAGPDVAPPAASGTPGATARAAGPTPTRTCAAGTGSTRIR